MLSPNWSLSLSLSSATCSNQFSRRGCCSHHLLEQSFTGASLSQTGTSSFHSNFPLRNSGVLRPGEMVLVLGAPGSGCTTFLKVVANERGTYTNVTGDVRYAGISHSEMLKYYKGEVVYNQEGKEDKTLHYNMFAHLPDRRYPYPHINRRTNPRLRPLDQGSRSRRPSTRCFQGGIQRRNPRSPSTDAQYLPHQIHSCR